MPCGLGRRAHPLGCGRRAHRGTQGVWELMRLGPVPGQLGLRSHGLRRERGSSLQRLCEPDVEPAAFARQQVLVDRLTHQGVPEAIALAVRLLDEHVVGHRFAQPVHELGLG